MCSFDQMLQNYQKKSFAELRNTPQFIAAHPADDCKTNSTTVLLGLLTDKDQQLTEAKQQLTTCIRQKRQLDETLVAVHRKRKAIHSAFVTVTNMHKTACQAYETVARENRRRYEAFEREIGKKD